ncbi:MAG: hypothetical protein COA79_26165 [Planctomycetota bacterium]|nr:MAG: hypothetical protein COA79_26165 [Planctomycetota bacterium]
MSNTEIINIGIVGACGRGASFKSACDALEGVTIHAVCDINEEGLSDAADRLGATEKYLDYDEMLEKSDIQAVVIGTPMQLHVEQSIKALQKNIHVMCEVTAAVSMEECKQLVNACNQSEAIYMMAENYTYTKHNVLIKELARKGYFGELFYAEGEYLHELKELNEKTPWRRKWQNGIDGITYGTHSLGPILQWMEGDRVQSVCCVGSGNHYKDPRDENYAQDTSVMLCKTVKGALIKIRLDMISDRPHAMTNYQLQGKDGCYESNRNGLVNDGKIWFRELSSKVAWHNVDELTTLDSLAKKYLPEIWTSPPKAALKAGHGGGDYFEVLDWIDSIRGKIKCPIGIHEAMDMTLPGLVSQESISKDGAWLTVPDSRTWA